MLDRPKSAISTLTAQWLTSRTFRFRAEPRGEVLSENFVFHPNGFIVGYRHPNETYWDLDGETVNVRDANGAVTCSLRASVLADGRACLTGAFVVPFRPTVASGVTHVMEEVESDYHARIQSFDLFDTLVARRCFAPLEIFAAVERKSGVAGFAHHRHALEMATFGRSAYGIGDIYQLLVSQNVLSQRQAEVLQLMELEEEWENLFPICEIIALVNPSDIIISDMYLPEAFVQRIVREKCHLSNKIYLSNYGKHSGAIWPHILENYRHREHFGDNAYADVVSPARCGVAARLVTASKWSEAEEVLNNVGLRPYAHALREARLRTHSEQALIRGAQAAQYAVNIPLLTIASLWLASLARASNADALLMCSRDCNLWTRLFNSEQVARLGAPAARYVQISRKLCYSQSPAYDAYFLQRVGQRTLLVDVVGTGRSLVYLLNRLGAAGRVRPCVLVADPVVGVENSAAYETFLTKPFHPYRLALESLNASVDGSAVGSRLADGLVAIEKSDNEFSPEARRTIAAMREAFLFFLAVLKDAPAVRARPPADALRSAGDAIVELIPKYIAMFVSLAEEQRRNL